MNCTTFPVLSCTNFTTMLNGDGRPQKLERMNLCFTMPLNSVRAGGRSCWMPLMSAPSDPKDTQGLACFVGFCVRLPPLPLHVSLFSRVEADRLLARYNPNLAAGAGASDTHSQAHAHTRSVSRLVGGHEWACEEVRSAQWRYLHFPFFPSYFV